MTKDQAYQFLKDINIAVLATSSENKPLASTMYYVVDNELNIYFITKDSTTKYTQINTNPNVSVVVTNRELVQTIQIMGIASTITDIPAKMSIIHQMSQANVKKKWLHWPPPISKVENGEMVVVKVTPNWMRFADYMQEDPSLVFSEVTLA